MPASPRDGGSITALLVDDEQLAREELGYLLRSFPEVTVLGEAEDGPGALERIQELQPDVVFLDVQMPGLSGLEVAREIMARRRKPPHIIFATAFDQYAVEAFEVNAADYLLKPVEIDRLGRSIERAWELMRSPERESERMARLLSALQEQATSPSKILVRVQGRMILVDAADVIFASVRDGGVRIVATEFEGHTNFKTLDELRSTLSDRRFWRPHRSFIVNIDRIKEVVPWFRSSYQLRMSDRDRTGIPVSRAQTKKLRKLFRL